MSMNAWEDYLDRKAKADRREKYEKTLKEIQSLPVTYICPDAEAS